MKKEKEAAVDKRALNATGQRQGQAAQGEPWLAQFTFRSYYMQQNQRWGRIRTQPK
jgi:hypothetical protein